MSEELRDFEAASDGSRESADGKVMVTRRYSEKSIVDPEDVSEMIPVGYYPTGVPLATVSYGCTMTLNLGNYESCKLFVSVTLPTPLEEIADAWEAARAFADERIGAECAKIRSYREAKGAEADGS